MGPGPRRRLRQAQSAPRASLTPAPGGRDNEPKDPAPRPQKPRLSRDGLNWPHQTATAHQPGRATTTTHATSWPIRARWRKWILRIKMTGKTEDRDHLLADNQVGEKGLREPLLPPEPSTGI